MENSLFWDELMQEVGLKLFVNLNKNRETTCLANDRKKENTAAIAD